MARSSTGRAGTASSTARSGPGLAGGMARGAWLAAVLAGAAVALCGCVAQPSATPPTPVRTVTVAASPAPTATTTAAASAGPSTTAAASPSESAAPTGSTGCPANQVPVPSGAMTAVVGDMDGDGRADTAFFSEAKPGFRYGIRTASGATIVLPDDLAGPGIHSGWTAGLDGPAIAITVLDDGRSATLHAFIGCRFVTTYGVDGKPFVFGLNGFYRTGTGVACNDRNGGTLLEGVLAKRRPTGRYDIRWTQIDLSPDGTRATVGATETRWSDLAPDDPRVTASMRSHCNAAPIVHTSGR